MKGLNVIKVMIHRLVISRFVGCIVIYIFAVMERKCIRKYFSLCYGMPPLSHVMVKFYGTIHLLILTLIALIIYGLLILLFFFSLQSS